ncbi:MAG: immune inhibitor A [Saprospirales bacterium]|nr:immune inhibitor A [Saprospirales bacterium]
MEIDHGDYAPGKYFSSDFSQEEIDLLTQNGWDFEVLIPDVSAWYAEHAWDQPLDQRDLECDNEAWGPTPWATPTQFTYGSMAGYYTYQEMLDILDQMAALYPNLITQRDTIPGFHTHDGHPLYWVKLSDNPQSDEAEPEALFTALHHAREPMSLSQLIFFMWHMLEGYGVNPEITYLIDETELYFIPCLNPDGYLYNEFTNPQGGGLWRKNRRFNTEDGSFGVDLNRNYGLGWGYDDTGSSPTPSSQVYRGPAAFSEPESQAAAAFCNSHDFQLALNYHSFGNLLIYPWAYIDTPCEDSTAFRGLAQALTRENFFLAGTGTETVGYVSNGSADDWMYGEAAVFSMTPEVGPGNQGFWPQAVYIEPQCKSTLLQNRTALHLLLVYGLAKDQSPWIITETEGELAYSFHRYGLKDGPLEVSLTGLNPYILSTSASQTHDLGQFESFQGAFSYQIDPATPVGTELNFLLTVDNGSISWSDTLRKIYQPGAGYVWEDASEEPDTWVSNPSWDWTTEHFKSPPRSWTDSPDENYPPNAFQDLVSETFLIDSVESVALNFWARWDIENNFDYVQFQALTPDETLLAPLCGRYTNSGTGNFQPNEEPLYDGFKGEWVEEVIDLSEYIGQPIRIRIVLRSDLGLQKDGFYIDDMKLLSFSTPETTRVKHLEFSSSPAFSIVPNPSPGHFLIELKNLTVSDFPAVLTISDLHGKKYREIEVLEWAQPISTEGLPAGIYTCSLRSGNAWLGAKKLVVQAP